MTPNMCALPQRRQIQPAAADSAASGGLEARLVELFEVRVRHRRLGRDAVAGLVPEHLREEIQAV